MSSAPLPRDVVLAALARLPAWEFDPQGPALKREYRFADFSAAFSFMTRVAELAERMNHHPDWCNRYNRVEVTLTTHDARGVTALDLSMAQAMDELACLGDLPRRA